MYASIVVIETKLEIYENKDGEMGKAKNTVLQ